MVIVKSFAHKRGKVCPNQIFCLVQHRLTYFLSLSFRFWLCFLGTPSLALTSDEGFDDVDVIGCRSHVDIFVGLPADRAGAERHERLVARMSPLIAAATSALIKARCLEIRRSRPFSRIGICSRNSSSKSVLKFRTFLRRPWGLPLCPGVGRQRLSDRMT